MSQNENIKPLRALDKELEGAFLFGLYTRVSYDTVAQSKRKETTLRNKTENRTYVSIHLLYALNPESKSVACRTDDDEGTV